MITLLLSMLLLVIGIAPMGIMLWYDKKEMAVGLFIGYTLLAIINYVAKIILKQKSIM